MSLLLFYIRKNNQEFFLFSQKKFYMLPLLTLREKCTSNFSLTLFQLLMTTNFDSVELFFIDLFKVKLVISNFFLLC